MLKLSNFMMLIFIFSLSSKAANFYVNSAASGTNSGLDWTNAWKQTSQIVYSKLNPGDTIYFAAGTYAELSIDKSGTAGNPITFKRATSADHGTSTGWNNSYDARVIFDAGRGFCAICIGGSVQANYITIDGSTRYGIWARNSFYGVKPRGPMNAANNLTIRYLEIGDSGPYRLDEDGIQGIGNNLLVEYSYIHDNDSTVTHGDGIQWFEGTGIIVRYNVFKNNGQLFMFGVESWKANVNDIEVYYNIFYNRGGTHYNGITLDKGSPELGHFTHIYNNTFDLEAVDNSGYNNIFNLSGPKGPVEFKNNAVLYSNAGSIANASHSYNAFDNAGKTSDYNIPDEPTRVTAADLGMVNVDKADYHLNSNSPLIGKGISVGLKQDFDGKLVLATPSIGAFEYGTSNTAPVPPSVEPAIKAPTNLKVKSKKLN